MKKSLATNKCINTAFWTCSIVSSSLVLRLALCSSILPQSFKWPPGGNTPARPNLRIHTNTLVRAHSFFAIMCSSLCVCESVHVISVQGCHHSRHQSVWAVKQQIHQLFLGQHTHTHTHSDRDCMNAVSVLFFFYHYSSILCLPPLSVSIKFSPHFALIANQLKQYWQSTVLNPRIHVCVRPYAYPTSCSLCQLCVWKTYEGTLGKYF